MTYYLRHSGQCYRIFLGSCSVAQSCLTLCDPMNCSTPGFPVLPIFWSLLKIMSIESVMPSNYLALCQHFLLPFIFPIIKVFSSESALCIRLPKYWSFSFCISPSNEYSGLISFRIDWFDLLSRRHISCRFLKTETNVYSENYFFLQNHFRLNCQLDALITPDSLL